MFQGFQLLRCFRGAIFTARARGIVCREGAGRFLPRRRKGARAQGILYREDAGEGFQGLKMF